MPAIHQRKVIRDAVAAALVAANTTVGTRVFKTQTVPWRQQKLPAVGIGILSETSEDQGSAPRQLTRTADLTIVGVLDASGQVDDALDALALEIERAMHADPTFGDVCNDSRLTGTELAIDEDGSKSIGFLRLTYQVTYYTGAPDADDVELVDLTAIDTTYSLENQQQPADQAEDTLTDLET